MLFFCPTLGGPYGMVPKNPEICAALSLEATDLQNQWLDWLEKNPPKKK